MWEQPLTWTVFGCFVSSICGQAGRVGPVKQPPKFCWVAVLATSTEELGRALPLFLAAQGPASPIQQMGGQGLRADGQPAALPLLVCSARTGRRQAPVGLATVAVTRTATSDEAAAGPRQKKCVVSTLLNDAVVACHAVPHVVSCFLCVLTSSCPDFNSGRSVWQPHRMNHPPSSAAALFAVTLLCELARQPSPLKLPFCLQDGPSHRI